MISNLGLFLRVFLPTLIYSVDPDEVAHNEHVRNILRAFADVNFVVCLLFSALIFMYSEYRYSKAIALNKKTKTK